MSVIEIYQQLRLTVAKFGGSALLTSPLGTYNLGRLPLLHMNRMVALSILALVFSAKSPAQQTAVTSSDSASPFLTMEHLVGDPSPGFTQVCLVLYADGHYHRERWRQVSLSNRPKPDWKVPEVFEGIVKKDEVAKLNEIVESEEFRRIRGTLGDASELFYKVRGGIPKDYIDVLAVSIARPQDSQVFEAYLGTSNSQDSLESFLKWLHAFEKTHEVVDKAAASNCAASSSAGAPPHHSRVAWNSPLPTLTYIVAPDYPVTEANANHTGKVAIRGIVNIDGSIGGVFLVRGMNPVLDQNAVDALKRWRFMPARFHGVPLAMPVILEVKFPFNRQEWTRPYDSGVLMPFVPQKPEFMPFTPMPHSKVIVRPWF